MPEQPEHDAEWWQAFRDASALRTRLKEARKRYDPHGQGEAVQAIKREAFDLLIRAGLPDPLRRLCAELWGGNFFERGDDLWLVAAWIEAQRPADPANKKPSTLGEKGLSRRIIEETGLPLTNYGLRTRIRGWWKDPRYWQQVNSIRFEREADEAAKGYGASA